MYKNDAAKIVRLINNYKSAAKQFEGRKNFLYLDSEGNVTIGIGHLLKNVQDAKKLSFYLDADHKQQASAEEIEKNFAVLEELKLSIKKPYSKYSADYYKPYTNISLTDKGINSLYTKDVKDTIRGLRRRNFDLASFPPSAQIAILEDLISLKKGLKWQIEWMRNSKNLKKL